MSEKRAKQARREKISRQTQPNPVVRMTVTVMDNSTVQVKGIPPEFNQAMDILTAGMRVVGMHFINAAIAGKCNGQGKMIGSNIIIPARNFG